ncbi:MAG: hypothetical protein ACPGYZ_09815 [Flavobacteriales bacterium]
MENEMLIPVTLTGIFTALAVLGVLRRNPLFVRLGYFLFGGMIVTFNVLGLLAGEVVHEGGIMEIMSIGIFLCQTIIAYPVVPADVDFNHPAIKTMGLRITMTLMIINATAVWLVLSMPEAPPAIVAAFHGILALIMGMRLVMIATGQNPPVHK